MRILITSSIYPTPAAPRIIGGAEIFVRRLAESLVESGDSVEVVRAASVSGQKPEKINCIEVHSAPQQNLYPAFGRHRSAPIRGIWHALEDWQHTAQLVSARIRAFKPDILHSNNLSGLTTAVWKTASELRVPVLHTLHDYYLTCPRCSRFSNGRSCVHTCMSCRLLTINRRDATKYLNAVVGVSQRILDIHTDLGLFRSTLVRRVIRHASTLGAVDPTPDGSDGPLRLGFIGRLTEEKGIFNLVRAVGKLPRDAVRLVIAGNASDDIKERICTLAPGADIEWLGFVEPEQFYRLIDIVVIPPIWEEPGPIVVADAQAAGKPFLGTRFGGIPEAVERGAVGWLTAPDPDSLAESISRLLSAPEEIAVMAKRLAAQASRRTFSDVVKDYHVTYEQLRRGEELPRP